MSSTIESTTYQHPVFTTDPEQFMKWLYKEICVTTEDGSTHTGHCYTVDPVSQTIVLVRIDEDGQNVEKLQLLMGHCIEIVTILDEDNNKYKPILDKLFRSDNHNNVLSPEEIKEKQENLKLWLFKNRLPVKISEDNSEVLNISDAAFIYPPYEADNCQSTNEIILGRVQGLIKNMPKDHKDW